MSSWTLTELLVQPQRFQKSTHAPLPFLEMSLDTKIHIVLPSRLVFLAINNALSPLPYCTIQ